jgi:predicted deacylase
MWRLIFLLGLLGGCASAAPPVSLAPVADPARWFPADYIGSRARFRADCERLKTSPADFCRSWNVPSETDKDLTIDYAFFSKGGDRLLVIQSGIHGTEAASGAAVQAYVMNTYVPALLARGIDVLVIHAMNPWGFKYGRRNDEDNVNLNRNFSPDDSIYETKNDDYRRFRSLMEPQGPVASVDLDSALGSLQFLGGVVVSGFQTKPLSDGLDNGQYDYPEGINFGGFVPQPQTIFLKREIAPILARPYRKTLYLDFHTGLGDNGVLAVILGIKPAPAPLAELKANFGGFENQGITIETGDSPGFFPTFGDVIDFVPSLSKRPDSFLAVTMEYGTLGTDAVSELKSANRMILENQKYNFGCRTPDVCATIDRDTRDMFNPSDSGWRGKVIQEADLVFRTLLDRL